MSTPPLPLTIPISSIVEGSRARSSKKYGDLTSLITSIRSIGLIQPIVLSSRADGKYDLVAGGRRFRSLLSIGATELVHGITLRPNVYGFIFETEVSESSRLEAELDENIHRLDMDWLDTVLLIDRVHSAKKAQHGGGRNWGQAQTAALLGYKDNASVSFATKIAALVRKNDKEILDCKSLNEALTLIIKRNEDSALAELQRRIAAKNGGTTPAPSFGIALGSGLTSFLDTINLSSEKRPLPVPTITLTDGPLVSLPPAVVPLSTMFRLGRMEDILPHYPDASFDHIITDIPYGIDMDNLDVKNQASVEAEHQVQDNKDLMPIFLSHAFRLTRPGGFCVFFFDLDHWNFLQDTAKSIGWKVQDWPYVACKLSPCRNNAPAYNLTKNYECAMFLRRDSNTVLRHPVTSSWKPYDFAAERALYANPFAKPFELWKDIFDMVAFPGQSILDPFAGENSCGRAAANCGLHPNGVEVSEVHYNRGLENMRKVYAVIHKSNVEFT